MNGPLGPWHAAEYVVAGLLVVPLSVALLLWGAESYERHRQPVLTVLLVVLALVVLPRL